MAEICLDCWNKDQAIPEKRRKFIMTRRPDLCEECGQWKPVIIRYKTRYILADLFAEFAEGLQYQRENRGK